MAKNSVHDYAKALYTVTKDLKGDALKQALKAFAELLYKNNLLRKFNLIIEAYEKVYKREEGIKEITITTARQIDKQTLEHIKKAFGDKVEATTAVDESLIGGMVVKTEDEILDASIRTQLRALQEHLV